MMLIDKQEEIVNKIKFLLGSIIEDAQLELFGVRISHHKASCAIKIFIDRPYGGIILGECARVNKRLIKEIDSEGFLGENYTLEVSSPGLEWPLKTKKDFLRISGHKTRLMLLEPIGGKMELSGVVTIADDDNVTIQCEGDNKDIPLTKIEKAIQII